MGSIFKAPKMPAPPPMVAPPEPDFSYEDEAREKQAAEDERRRNRNRKGRRSTILNTSKGLDEIEEENLKKTSLLGG